MYKIALISISENGTAVREEPGISFISAVLRENGYNVLLTGANDDAFDMRKLTSFMPDIIGLPVYNETKDMIFKFCKKVRQNLPDVLICLGGYLPTYHSIEVMVEAPFVDFLIRGEGEQVWLDLISHLEEGSELGSIRGLTYRSNGIIKENEYQELIKDLNSLPYQSRDIMIEHNLKYVFFSTNRGCQKIAIFAALTISGHRRGISGEGVMLKRLLTK